MTHGVDSKMALLTLWILFSTFFELSYSSKYSKDTNENTKLFRLNKHNLLWQKAVKRLGPTDLEHLRVDLKKLDKISMELKHANEEDRDKMGDLEAEVREKFIEITEKYGIVNNDVKDNDFKKKKQFNHEKVKSLWDKALYEGVFKQHELEELKKELEHHEEKIKEYHLLSELIDKHDTVSENDIASLDTLSRSELKSKRRELKDKYHEINDHYSVLNDKIQKRLPKAEEEFRDHRVLDLWRKAHHLGFSEDELKSIREELKHFQNRIDKHEHWKVEHEKLVTAGKGPEQDAHFAHVSQKLQEHGKLVKKYHATMIDRVFKREEL